MMPKWSHSMSTYVAVCNQMVLENDGQLSGNSSFSNELDF